MTLHFLDTYFLVSLIEILPSHARFEHRHVFASRFGEAISAKDNWAFSSFGEFAKIGYQLLRREPGVVYFAFHEDRIAIVRDNDGHDPERLVYVFPPGDVGHSCFMDLYRRFDGGSSIWEKLSNGTNHRGVCSLIVRHISTKQVVEFVHRDELIFPGIEW